MQTKKHNKKRNKLTMSFKKGGGFNDTVKEIEEKPAYIKYTILMLGISSAYIFFKLTKG